MSRGRYDIVIKGLRLRDNWIPINTPLSSCVDYPCFSVLCSDANDGTDEDHSKGCK